MQVKWTEPAAKALENIQDYIAKDNPRAAFEVAQEIQILSVYHTSRKWPDAFD